MAACSPAKSKGSRTLLRLCSHELTASVGRRPCSDGPIPG
jgi:hypothetical protein